MQRFDVVRAEARVVECLSADLLRLELSNGHQFLAHRGEATFPAEQSSSRQCLPGCKVLVELRAFDLSSGKVLDVLVS